MNIMIQGPPGVGKTSLILKLVDQLQGQGVPAAGFYTEEIREAGQRTGFRIKSLAGKEGMLSSINQASSLRVGRYSVDLEEFERVGVTALKEALHREQLMIVDEIGKMELFSLAFRRAVTEALNSPNPLVATIGVSGHPFMRRVMAREDLVLFVVSPENRDLLVSEAMEILKA